MQARRLRQAQTRFAEQAARTLRLALRANGPDRYLLIEQALKLHRLAVDHAGDRPGRADGAKVRKARPPGDGFGSDRADG